MKKQNLKNQIFHKNPDKNKFPGFKKITPISGSVYFICCLVIISLFAPKPSSACTVKIPIQQAITAITLDIVKKTVTFAKREGCSSIFLTMDTPGGSLPVTRLLIQEILNSPVPFLCLVSPAGAQAASAGAIILQSCHVNGAIKGTNMGSATPVLLGKNMEKESDMRKKAVNDTLSFLDSLTNLRKRNKKFGQDIVSDAKSVTAEEAHRLKAVDFTGHTAQDFLDFAQGREVKMAEGKKMVVKVGALLPFPLNFRYKVLIFFADPQFLYMMFLGSIGLIYFELTHPGFLLPGIVGGIGLILSLIGLNAFSVMWGAVALILLGFALLLGEAFVPSFGILGVGGIAAFILGSLYLFDPAETGGYTLPLSLILSVSLIIGLLMMGIAILAFKTFRMKKHKTGLDSLVGEKGEVTELLSEEKGWMIIQGENWKFVSTDKLKKGDKAEVTACENMTLKVKKV
ncbi:MAG: nodulation protein NfeD [Bdellovibrionales bacterium]|nr:nodulation protein NfeD [Bdellovibrionales bacterium]